MAISDLWLGPHAFAQQKEIISDNAIGQQHLGKIDVPASNR